MQSTEIKKSDLPLLSGPMLIDIYEASDLLGLKVSRLRLAVFRREIPYRKIGGLVRFIPSELREWVGCEKLNPKRI